MSKVVIAGGTGFIGRLLEDALKMKGHDVFILTRSPKNINHIYWNPSAEELDDDKIRDAEVIINLCGQGIADARWTKERVDELYNSRVLPLKFLAKATADWSNLKRVISASGIDCYVRGIAEKAKEEEPFGNYMVANLVERWEKAIDELERDNVRVYKLRIAMVLHPQDGAIGKLLPVVKMGLASGLGTGKQIMNWIHWEDLDRAIYHFMKEDVPSGAYNLCGNPVSNKDFMKNLASAKGKPFFMPNVPGFVLKLVYGELSELLLQGRAADNSKMKEAGFEFSYNTIEEAFENF